MVQGYHLKLYELIVPGLKPSASTYTKKKNFICIYIIFFSENVKIYARQFSVKYLITFFTTQEILLLAQLLTYRVCIWI